jgi:DNA-directed RNA polymerase-3 subunit RPC5
MLLAKGRVQVLLFEHLMRLAPTGSTEKEVLEVLLQFAYLVQGCWVATSSLRYNGDICKVRDYFILQFNKNRLVRHEQLEELKLPKETIREVSVSLVVQRPAVGGWEFQEVTNRSFMKNHQNIVKEQSQRWSENEEGIRKEAFSFKIVNKDNLKSTESSSQHSNTIATSSRKGSVKTDMNCTAQGVKPAQFIDGG